MNKHLIHNAVKRDVLMRPAMVMAVVLAALLGYTPRIGAQERPVTGTYSFEIGRKHAYSQYLAPVNYAGTQYGLSGSWNKALPFSPQRAMMSFDTEVTFAPSMLNPRRTASMFGMNVNFSWSMLAYWNLPYNLAVGVGGGPELEAGGLALMKNSNNPAAPNLAFGIGVDAFLSWRYKIGKLPFTISYRMQMPLLGAFYMNGYGETYYEIWLGNREGLVNFGYPASRTKIDSHIALKLDFGKTAMEIGYRFEFNRAHANNLTYRFYSNAFTIGVIPGGLGLKTGKNEIRPGIINP